MVRINRPWTTGELKRAIELRTVHKLTLAATAKELGRSRGAVSMQLHLYGHTKRQPVQKRTGKRRSRGQFMRLVKRHWRPGTSDEDLARKLGTDRSVVRRARLRLGLPSKTALGFRRTMKKRGSSPPPKCWGCGADGDRCAGTRSLTSMGWYASEKGSFGQRETYCPTCVSEYGTPETWGVAGALPEL